MLMDWPLIQWPSWEQRKTMVLAMSVPVRRMGHPLRGCFAPSRPLTLCERDVYLRTPRGRVPLRIAKGAA